MKSRPWDKRDKVGRHRGRKPGTHTANSQHSLRSGFFLWRICSLQSPLRFLCNFHCPYCCTNMLTICNICCYKSAPLARQNSHLGYPDPRGEMQGGLWSSQLPALQCNVRDDDIWSDKTSASEPNESIPGQSLIIWNFNMRDRNIWIFVSFHSAPFD